MGSEGIVTVDGMKAAPLARAPVVSPERHLMLLRKLLEVAMTVYATDLSHEENARKREVDELLHIIRQRQCDAA